MKKIISLVSVLMTFALMLSCYSINAYASSKIVDDWGLLYDNEDYYETFTLSRKTKINIKFKSTYPTYFFVIDEETEYYIIETYEITSYSETLTLEAGKYSYFVTYFEDDSYEDGLRESTDFTVTITDKTEYASSIKLKTKSKRLSVGNSFTIKYSVSPSNSVAKKITWSSSNKKVATVNSSGKVTAKGLGTCKITAKLNNGKKYTCKITVDTMNMYIFKGSQRTLPKINSKKTVKWKTNNSSYASVNKQKVKGKKAGKTSLSVKYSGEKYKCNLYIVDYNKMFKDSKESLRDRLKDPDSLKIYHIWRGYDIDGEPNITLDYGAKNSYGGYERDYFNFYRHYDAKKKKFKNGCYFTENRPKLTSEKKVK